MILERPSVAFKLVNEVSGDHLHHKRKLQCKLLFLVEVSQKYISGIKGNNDIGGGNSFFIASDLGM